MEKTLHALSADIRENQLPLQKVSFRKQLHNYGSKNVTESLTHGKHCENFDDVSTMLASHGKMYKKHFNSKSLDNGQQAIHYLDAGETKVQARGIKFELINSYLL